MMLRRWIVSVALFVLPLWAHADWAADRDASAGYVTVTTLATAVDEAVPFCVVYLSDLPADFHTAMTTASDTDGKTIRVSNSDGTTQLACVPIGVNTGTDTGCLIFIGTGMSASTDVDYRIYVGNASLTMPAASAGEQLVFASYAGVYFPGVDTRDWTAGGRTLTAVNSPGTAASGYEGITAATYDGSTQYHHYSGSQCLASWPMTIESLAYTTRNTVAEVIAAFSTSTINSGYADLFFDGAAVGDPISSSFLGPTGSASTSITSAGYSTATWYAVAASRSGTTTGTGTTYINGGSSGSNSTTVVAASFDRFTIGSLLISAGVFAKLNGRVAVALLSSSVRSANYVSTMQDNWAGTMYSAGAWTANDSDVVAGSTGWVLFQTIGQSTSAAADWTNTGNAIIDDSTYAYADLESGAVENSEYLNLTNPAYGTTIPTGAPSYTVEFRIKRYRDTGGGDEIQDLTVQFIDDTGTRVGDNKADTVTDWPTSAGTVEYTITGITPDGTEFTSAAGLAFRATGVNGAFISQARVVTAWMRVSWTGTDAAYNTRGFFALTE